jgi:hypothetical protein
MMTPNIYDIIDTCLNIGKNIIFYLPRTTILPEFFEIMEKILKERKKNKIIFEKNKEFFVKNYDIFVDIHILNSANKIKAVLLVFGNNIEEEV